MKFSSVFYLGVVLFALGSKAAVDSAAADRGIIDQEGPHAADEEPLFQAVLRYVPEEPGGEPVARYFIIENESAAASRFEELEENQANSSDESEGPVTFVNEKPGGQVAQQDDQGCKTFVEVGIASTYSDPQPTSSGEYFNPNHMTAAHKTIPHGRKVRVENVATGRSIFVKITDRGPWVKKRVLDLSQRAADALGSDGLCRVRIFDCLINLPIFRSGGGEHVHRGHVSHHHPNPHQHYRHRRHPSE